MKYYCECISVPLAEKLKEKGMPNIFLGGKLTPPTFGACFDWLMFKRGVRIYIILKTNFDDVWYPAINEKSITPEIGYKDWHEAAKAAIEKALTLI